MTQDTETPTRPNVVLVLTDQHRYDHTGFGGNPVLQTPHLDALAARATSFSNAIVANPICMPNRATILTGRMPSAHGTRTNGIPLDWHAATVARQLRRAGYRTGLVGKAHFQNMGQVPGLFGDPTPPGPNEPHLPPGWDELELGDRYRAGDVDLPDDYYGFEHVELAVGHADQVSGHYLRWLLAQGVDPAAVQRPRSGDDHFEPWWQIWRTALPEDLYPTAWVGQRSIAYIEEAAAAKQPFFLQVSFPDPHHPFTPPGRYYDPADIPLPATFDDAHETSVPHLQTWRATRGAEPPAFPVMPFSPTEAIYREAAAKEYGAITMIDATVGTILDALERTGCATDTVVVFTSDHGEMFGDHGLMLKGAMHYLPALRVPLLIADPRRADNHATVDSSLVGSIDLASTILDLTGTPVYAGMQGHSLVPRLDGDAGLVHDEVLVEEDEPFDLAGVGQPLRMRTLITDTTRLTIYQGAARGELLDLARDPGETRNLWDDPGRRELRADMTERLARSVIEHAEQGTIPTHGA